MESPSELILLSTCPLSLLFDILCRDLPWIFSVGFLPDNSILCVLLRECESVLIKRADPNFWFWISAFTFPIASLSCRKSSWRPKPLTRICDEWKIIQSCSLKFHFSKALSDTWRGSVSMGRHETKLALANFLTSTCNIHSNGLSTFIERSS